MTLVNLMMVGDEVVVMVIVGYYWNLSGVVVMVLVVVRFRKHDFGKPDDGW